MHLRAHARACIMMRSTYIFNNTCMQVKDLIRKAKMWRNLIYRDTHRARPKSYLMALLVIAAHERAGSAEASA